MTGQVGRVEYRHDERMASNEFWVLSENRNAETTSLMRISETGDGPAMTAVVILAEDITSTTLKKMRIGSVPLRDFGGAEENPFGWLVASGAQPQGLQDLTAAIDAAMAAAAPRTHRARARRAPRPPLTRPDRNDPDGHAEAVAASYAEHASAGRHPGLAIAEEAGVPVATARGWIREARRRGKLPKGRRGRAG